MGDLPVDYYINALKTLDKPGKVLVFGKKEDHEEIKEKLQNIKNSINTFVIVDDSIPDWKQMLIMSCCDANIITNSTFSWWGAYLNQKKDKIVFYPGPNINLDMFPSEWIQVSCQKIDC
jgi:ADP-heptose:LPS heptosyltransferase